MVEHLFTEAADPASIPAAEVQNFEAYNLPQNYLDIAENARGFVVMVLP